MVVFNYTGRELSGKIVYYGPALSGKTTNLEQIYGQTPANTRGKMVSMKTKAERTLFFDLLPINRGTIGDFKVRFLLYTVPGQVYYNATRKLVLKGADAIVFVADSQRSQLAANVESLRNLRTNLLEYGMCLDDLPWVITYNKRDMPDAMPIEELERELNPNGVPSFGQVAPSCEGVFEAFEKVSEMLMERLEAQLKGDAGRSKRAAAPAPPAPAAPAAPAPPPRPAAPSVREVTDAIRSAAPPPPPPPVAPPRGRPGSELVVQREYDVVSQGSATPHPARGGVAVAADGPLVIQKQIVVPVSLAELQGHRKVRLILDVTIEPR
jgi:signal recognition particle receptor subunit beta